MGAFKSRVDDEFVTPAQDGGQTSKMAALFAKHPHDEREAAERLDVLASWVRYLAEVFLDADAYNAAKHGMALRGERSHLRVDVEGLNIIDTDGFSFELLHAVMDQTDGVAGDLPSAGTPSR